MSTTENGDPGKITSYLEGRDGKGESQALKRSVKSLSQHTPSYRHRSCTWAPWVRLGAKHLPRAVCCGVTLLPVTGTLREEERLPHGCLCEWKKL